VSFLSPFVSDLALLERIRDRFAHAFTELLLNF
jgi:hypothetical protein